MTLKNSLTRIGKLVVVFAIALSLLLGTAVPPSIAQDLPLPDPEFHGIITDNYVTSEADESLLVPPTEPPEEAPNVVLIMLDDVGFGASETFGGPVHTPTLEKLAAHGLSYNRFHTTAMCAPTRAALLTGRNHHSSGFGVVPEMSTGFPGYTGLISQSTATVAKILQDHGYNTAWFGKNHNLAAAQGTNVGPFTRWPNELGFDYFYGFTGGGGETDQWYPSLYENRNPINQPSYPKEDDLDNSYNLTRDLADKAISWVQNKKSLSPDTPFFLYFAPGATHAPHQPPPSYTEKYQAGGEHTKKVGATDEMFVEGWDVVHANICENQKNMGIIPDNAECTERPKEIPAWDSSYFGEDDEYRSLMALQMQNYAGYLEYTDEQVGRVIDAIYKLGEKDNTLIIYIVGDNGASAEGSLTGTCNIFATYADLEFTQEENLACKDNWGHPGTSPHFAVGWTWATNAPFRWTKQVASYFGGTRNPMVISWPNGIKFKHPHSSDPIDVKEARKANLREQFLHVIDVAPTILDVVGINPPSQVNDISQKPMEGASFVNTFKSDGAEATPLRDTQYFELMGYRGIYHDGWMASSFHRLPWEISAETTMTKYDSDPGEWELFNLNDDFTQNDNLAPDIQHDNLAHLLESKNQEHSTKLEEMKALFDSEAKKYNVYPIDDRFIERAKLPRPTVFDDDRTHFTFYPGFIFLPGEVAPNFGLRSYIITADLNITDPTEVQGTIFAYGGDNGGFSLYVKNEKDEKDPDQDKPSLVFEYNYMNLDRTQIVLQHQLPQDDSQVAFFFNYEPHQLVDLEENLIPVCFETTDGTLLQDLPDQGLLENLNPEDLRDREHLQAAIQKNIRMVGCGGTGTLYINGKPVVSNSIEKTYYGNFEDSLDVGMDLRTPVSEDYEPPFEFTGGEIKKVTIKLDPSDEDIASLDEPNINLSEDS